MRRSSISFLVLAALHAGAAARAAEPFAPAPLPPLLPWEGASRSLAVAPDDPWATPAERSGLAASPSYDETVAWLRRLVDAAPELAMVSIGSSPQGREIWMVIASAEGAATPAAVHASGRPVVLAQAGIHAGEIDGKDAGMMLLRDLTVRGARRDLLDRATLLFVPIFNVDGHERSGPWNRMNQRGPERMGWRTNARNLNLNRDYAKADTEEMQAMLAAIDRWRPDLYLDLHVTDGADYRYDVTYGFTGPHAHSPAIARWLGEAFSPVVDARLREAGHVPGPLIQHVDPLDFGAGILGWTADPRFSNGYGDARHLPTVLVENHSLKPFDRRVLGTYVLLAAALEAAGEQGDGLREAIAADRDRRPATLPLDWKPAETRTTVPIQGIGSRLAISPVTGGAYLEWTGEPVDLEVPVIDMTVPAAEVATPKAWWVPVEWAEVIDRLALHGIAMERIAAPREVEVEMYRLEDPTLAEAPFEGHVRATATPVPERRTETFPAGSARIPADQPLADLAALLLEPDSPDSFFQWGFFHEVLSRTEYAEDYVLEPLAARMLAEDPALREAYEEKLRDDAVFRADPAARLAWFYERTPYFDPRWRLYPVAREVAR